MFGPRFCFEGLLEKNEKYRTKIQRIKRQLYYKNIDFKSLLEKKIEPPFKVTFSASDF